MLTLFEGTRVVLEGVLKNMPSNLEGVLKNTPSKTTLGPSKSKLTFVLEGVLKNTPSNLEGVRRRIEKYAF